MKYCYIKQGDLVCTSDVLIEKRQDEILETVEEKSIWDDWKEKTTIKTIAVKPFVDGMVYDEVIETDIIWDVVFQDWKIIKLEDSIEYQKQKEAQEELANQVPQELTPRQVRLAILWSGLDLSQIDTMIDWLDEPQKSQIKIMREYSTVFLRKDPVLNDFAEQLGLSQDDVDNLFIAWALGLK